MTRAERVTERKVQFKEEIRTAFRDGWNNSASIEDAHERMKVATKAADRFIQSRIDQRPQDKSFIMSVAFEFRDEFGSIIDKYIEKAKEEGRIKQKEG